MPHSEISEVTAPRSQFYHGPYGRMFRNLPPHVPTFDLIKTLSIEGEKKKLTEKIKKKFPQIPQNSDSSLRVFVKTVSDAEKIWKQFEKIKTETSNGQYSEETRESILKILARTMIETPKQSRDSARDNKTIPAGYTYFSQFITHDITFDPTSSLMRFNDPNKLRNFRTPRLDLDSLYGGGPDDAPFLYQYASTDPTRKYYLLIDRTENKEDDLPRNSQGRALIGDPRNDENIMVSQLQLAFIKFHNALMDKLLATKKMTAKRAFREVQRLVQWHYQWVILYDFLPKIVGKKVLEKILCSSGCPGQPKLCYYRWRNQPFIPVEFAMAAFRFGHSMIRNEYHLNDKTKHLTLSQSFTDLRGFKHLPKNWTIDWEFFLRINDISKLQLSRQIDTRLSNALAESPSISAGANDHSLASLDLLRGYKFDLPSGQAVARAIGEKPLKNDSSEEPLWYYILREAEELGKGRTLGPVGGRIVAEVIIGILAGDPHSFININSNWQPMYSSFGGDFELRDILSPSMAV